MPRKLFILSASGVYFTYGANGLKLFLRPEKGFVCLVFLVWWVLGNNLTA